MNWRHETWRKLYIREEGSFAALSYSARAAAAMLLKICDEQGRIYSRHGEEILDAICFRFGADRGERRMVKKGIDELVADEHLVIGLGWVRIRNFRRAQGHPDEVGPEVAATMLRSGRDDVANDTRPCSDDDATGSPSCSDDVANGARPRTEDCVNDAELLKAGGTVPSVPSEGFLPSDGTPPTRDPSSTEVAAPAAQPRWRSGYAWWFAFGLAWRDGPGEGHFSYGNGGDTKAQGELDGVLARMTTVELEGLWHRRGEFFDRFFASKSQRLVEGRYAFALFVARWSDFRPDLPEPRAAPARASPPRNVAVGWAAPSGDYGKPGVQKL